MSLVSNLIAIKSVTLGSYDGHVIGVHPDCNNNVTIGSYDGHVNNDILTKILIVFVFFKSNFIKC